MFGLTDGDSYFKSSKRDPYITVQDVPSPPDVSFLSLLSFSCSQKHKPLHVLFFLFLLWLFVHVWRCGPFLQDEDDSDLEDFTIRHTDALIVAGTAEEDYSHVDVHIYEEQDDNMYVHHDIMLPTYPLCLAWTDFNIVEPSSAGELPQPCVLFFHSLI